MHEDCDNKCDSSRKRAQGQGRSARASAARRVMRRSRRSPAHRPAPPRSRPRRRHWQAPDRRAPSRIDAAGRAEDEARQRAGEALEESRAARGLGREELEGGEAIGRQRHGLGHRGAARQHRHRAGRQPDRESRRRARRNQEPGAGGGCHLDVLDPRDGAGADHRLRHLAGDLADGGERLRRAQRHLDDRQSAGDQRPGERHRDAGILDGQDGNDGCGGKQRAGIGKHGGLTGMEDT